MKTVSQHLISKFNKNFVNYEIDVTQNGDRLLKETEHALGTTVTYKVTAQGSVENQLMSRSHPWESDFQDKKTDGLDQLV